MGRLLTSDDEEVFRSFRPHIFSYVPTYALAFAWLAWGAAGWSVRAGLGGGAGQWVGWVVMVVLILAHGVLRARVRGDRRIWLHHMIAVAVVAGVASAEAFWPQWPAAAGDLTPAVVGALLSLVSLVARETVRLTSVTYVTSTRVVARRGLAPRRELVFLYKDLDGAESVQGVLGSIFGFGRIFLIKKARRRRRTTTKRAETETDEAETFEIGGVPDFEAARHDVNTLIEEARLSIKERQRRSEERRLRQTMSRLSRWHPRGGT
jgi:hypothetical protein